MCEYPFDFVYQQKADISQLQTIPPTYRPKDSWYRKRMDLLVHNDTRGLHWTLNPSESRRLLAVLFPDRELFQRSVELLPAASSGPFLKMNDILERLWDGNHYRKETQDEDNVKDKDMKGKGKDTKGMGKATKKKKAMKKKDSECWLRGPLAIKSESNIACFLNVIMDAVKGAVSGKFLNKQYVIGL